jgi:uncharacterized ferritin-like protein (DUF455 family)
VTVTGPEASPPEAAGAGLWPPAGTVEAWAARLVWSDRWADKLYPPPVPGAWEQAPPERHFARPGRPPELRLATRGLRIAQQLTEPRARAKLIHTLLHHELQAAELMAWALLRFAGADPRFRQGLLAICLDELSHLHAYRERLEQLGFSVGDFPVRDWFWERVPTCQTPLQFVALMGMGLEAANLEHAPRFGARFAAAGDDASAKLQARIAREEEGHVRFGLHWYEIWTNKEQTLKRWQRELPPPLSPLLMRGEPLAHAARARAGMRPEFLAELAAWQPDDAERARV